MGLKTIVWSGYFYTLKIERNWQYFFDLVPTCYIRGPDATIFLPQGAGYHILDTYEMLQDERPNFGRFDDFYSFSRKMCDQYCDHFVMKRPLKDNAFAGEPTRSRYAMRTFAHSSHGYSLGIKKD